MTTCPKCGYVRKPTDTVPDWECPSCNIAYAKYHAAPPVAHVAAHGAPAPDAEREDAAGGTFYDHPFVHIASFGVAIAVSWFVYTFTEGTAQYEHYGWISGIDLMRVLAVAFDIYVAGSFFNSLLDALARPLKQSHHRFAFAAGCLALAFTLHYSGIMAKVYAGLGLKMPGPAASIGMLRSYCCGKEWPDLPLEEIAGDWYGVAQKRAPGSSGHGAGAITRVHVSVANGEARMQIWRFCPPRECDSGSYPAIIESRRRGTAVALHVTGTTDGTDWLVTLYTHPGHMMLDENRLRGTDLRNKRGFGDWMVRANDRLLN